MILSFNHPSDILKQLKKKSESNRKSKEDKNQMISNHHGRKSYPSKRILNLNTWSQLNSISMFFSLGNASQFHLYFHFAVRSSLRKHQKRAFLFNNFASFPSLFSIFASFLFLSRLAFAPSGFKK